MWGDKSQERERVHPCNVCNIAFKSLQMPSQHKVWQHSGDMFACKGCGKKINPNNSINRHNKLVCGKPHHRKIFCHFSMWAIPCQRSEKKGQCRKVDFFIDMWKIIRQIGDFGRFLNNFCDFWVFLAKNQNYPKKTVLKKWNLTKKNSFFLNLF